MRGWRASSRPAFGYCTQPAGRTRRTRSRAVRVYTWTLNRCAPHGSHHSAAQVSGQLWASLSSPEGGGKATMPRATLTPLLPHMEEVVLTAGSDSGAIHTWKVAGTTFLQQSAPNSSLPRGAGHCCLRVAFRLTANAPVPGAAVIAAGLSCPPQWVAAAQAGKPAIHVWRWGKVCAPASRLQSPGGDFRRAPPPKEQYR